MRHRGRGVDRNTPVGFNELAVEVDPAEVSEEDVKERTRFLDDTSRSVISTNTSPDLGFDASLNPYRGCEHGCSYCLAGETLILMADGRSKRLDEVKVGDEIIGTQRIGAYRRLVPTKVLDHWSTVKSAYRVSLADGTVLIASGDHRFLTERGWKHVTGSQQGAARRPHLTTANKLMGCGRAVKSSSKLQVTGIEPHAAACRLYDITTGTGDFIANGVVSHNCYARPTHEYLGLSAGLDFERVIMVKRRAAELLESELRKKSWQPKVLMLSGVTDPYQPVERRLEVTRECLKVLARFKNPVSIITKNALVTRDADLLSEMASWNGARVTLSITTLDEALRSRLEPRTSTIANRLRAIRELAAAGVPVGVNVAPVIPGLTDHEMPGILEAAAAAGASHAGFTVVRLPGAVSELFTDWLDEHAPLRKQRVLNRIGEAHLGDLDDKRFGLRMSGSGGHAEQIGALFRLTRKRLGMGKRGEPLNTAEFAVPGRMRQGTLF